MIHKKCVPKNPFVCHRQENGKAQDHRSETRYEGYRPVTYLEGKGFKYDTEATYTDRISVVFISPSRQIIGQYLKLCIPLVYLTTLTRF